MSSNWINESPRTVKSLVWNSALKLGRKKENFEGGKKCNSLLGKGEIARSPFSEDREIGNLSNNKIRRGNVERKENLSLPRGNFRRTSSKASRASGEKNSS